MLLKYNLYSSFMVADSSIELYQKITYVKNSWNSYVRLAEQ